MIQDTIFYQLLFSLILLIGFFILRFFLRKVVKRFAKRFERVENRTGLVLRYIDFFSILLIILGLIVIWGIQIEDLGWIMSSVFAVIGIGFFAQWSILSNITSGIIMFFTFPYKIGDYIIIHDKEFEFEGYIENIKAFQMVLKSTKGNIITYPNSLLMSKGVSIIQIKDIPLEPSNEGSDKTEDNLY